MIPEKYFVSDRVPEYITGLAYYPYDAKLEKRFACVDRFGVPFNVSRHLAHRLALPRELARNAPLHDYRTSGDPIKLDLSKTNKPRNKEQVRVLKESLELLGEGVSHIIEGSTGFGKTYVGLTLAGHLSLKLLVVVNKEDGLKKWRDDAKKFLKITDDDIGYIQQDRCEVEGKKVVIAMVQSLYKEKYDVEIYKAFGLLIFDEVHHMAADKFSIAAGLFNARLRLGLTATATRPDGRQFVFEAHIGPVLVSTTFMPMPPKILVVRSDWKCPLVPRKVNGAWKMTKLPHEHGKLGAVLKDLAKCESRNRLIARLALLAYQAGRTTVLLSDLARKLHLDLLCEYAIEAGIPEEETAFYVGGMKEAAIEAAKTKRIVFATYQMAGEATDVPWWDTLILASPRANIKQPLGRILREYPDKKQPIAFDVLDADSRVLMDYYHARLKVYRSAEISGTVKEAHV